MAEKRARKLKMLADEKRRLDNGLRANRRKLPKFFDVCSQFRDPFPEDQEDTRPVEVRKRRKPKFSERLGKIEQRWAEGKDHEGRERS